MKLSHILVAALFTLSLGAAVLEAGRSKGVRSSQCKCGETCHAQVAIAVSNHGVLLRVWKQASWFYE